LALATLAARCIREATVFDDTSDMLVRWAREVVGDAAVHLGPPPPFTPGHGVAIRLLDITPQPVPRERRYRRLHASLRYLVTAWADDDATAHRLLGRLTFAAMQHPTIELRPEPPPVALWQALGLAPRPGLLLECRAFHDMPEDDDSIPVRRTIFASTPDARLDGRVVGADGRPVDRATVAVPKYHLRAETDDAGRFHLPPLPRNERATLVVHANGQQQAIDLVNAGGRSAGVVIQLDRM
jgi:hypothetical protein